MNYLQAVKCSFVTITVRKAIWNATDRLNLWSMTFPESRRLFISTTATTIPFQQHKYFPFLFRVSFPILLGSSLRSFAIRFHHQNSLKVAIKRDISRFSRDFLRIPFDSLDSIELFPSRPIHYCLRIY